MSETTQPTVTPTAARPAMNKGGSHFYQLDGTPCFEVPNKSTGGMRKATLADARKLNLLPSVTTILRLLDKPALNTWKIEQAALAVLTAPRKQVVVKDPVTGIESMAEEPLDQFVLRVLHTEEQQDEEAALARDKGKLIHAAIESYFNGQGIPDDMGQYVNAPINAVLQFGQRASSEVIFVGDDYAGMGDLVQDCGEYWNIWDFKSAKKLPDPRKGGAWDEHKLQLAAYAKAWQNKLVRAGSGLRPIFCRNLYISSTTPGEYVICEHEDWEGAYERGFAPLVTIWQWMTGYRPENPNREVDMPATATDVQKRVSAHGEALDTELKARAYTIALEEEVKLLKAHLEAERKPEGEPLIPANLIMGRFEALEAMLKNIAPAPGAPRPAPAPQPPRPSPMPPMGRPPAQTGGAIPPKFTPPTPTLPSTSKSGKRLMWDNGVAQVPTPAPEEAT